MSPQRQLKNMIIFYQLIISFLKLLKINNKPIINEIGGITFVRIIKESIIPVMIGKPRKISGLKMDPIVTNMAPTIISSIFPLVEFEFFRNITKKRNGTNEVKKKIIISTKFGKGVKPSSNAIMKGIIPAK